MNNDQIEIFAGKWKAGYRPGDEGWSPEDQETYGLMIALALILYEDYDLLRELAEHE